MEQSKFKTSPRPRPGHFIDGDVSDLFFNLDFEDVKHYNYSGATGRSELVFAGFDEEKLRERAQWFCNAIYRVSGRLFSADDILADFKGRI